MNDNPVLDFGIDKQSLQTPYMIIWCDIPRGDGPLILTIRSCHRYDGPTFHIVARRDLRIFLSCVTSGSACARAVATIKRSAGSAWKDEGNSFSAETTSASSGNTLTVSSAVIRWIHSSNDSDSARRFLETSICASQMLIAEIKGRPCSASESSASDSRF